jgi:plastocyanin
MRRVGLRRASVYGAAVAASLGCALLVAGQTAAQYPTYTYPTTTSPGPTYTSPGPMTGSPGGKTVAITGTSPSDYGFQPRKLKVKAGSRVTWSWQSNAPHNVTFKKTGKASQTGSSETYSLRFKHAGTFPYFCSIHGFTGKIVVHKK